jgi:ATP-dependent HslUV protease subunit HslV
MVVADEERSLLISGTGDVIEADDGVLAIGSGGNFALAAARALMRHTQMTADELVRESLSIAGDICVYTNDRHTVLELEGGASK